MNPIVVLLESVAVGFVEIFCILSVTDRKRFHDWLSYLIGMTLVFLTGINNNLWNFMDNNILFFGSFLFIFLVLSKDRMIKRIATFGVYAVTYIIVELILELIAGQVGASVDEYSIQTEILSTYGTVLVDSIFLSAVIIYRRKKMKNISLPISLFIIIALLTTVYDLLILTEQQRPLFITMAIFAAVILNTVFVLVFFHYVRVSAMVYKTAKEKEVMAQIEEYDKEYFDLVQNEIDKARYIRHDVVNYIEQIEALTAMEDRESLELADRLSGELEERLQNQ